MSGGELFDRIVKKRCYSEEEARYSFSLSLSNKYQSQFGPVADYPSLLRIALLMIANAVCYLHGQSIVHRDLKVSGYCIPF